MWVDNDVSFVKLPILIILDVFNTRIFVTATDYFWLSVCI